MQMKNNIRTCSQKQNLTDKETPKGLLLRTGLSNPKNSF